MVFPGQGSQKLGMLSDVAKHEPEVLKTFAEASECLGYDLWELTQTDEARLQQTMYTQPALLTASVALWRIWQQKEFPAPTMMAGHSLGEYTALVCAQSISFIDAVQLVSKRGELMQKAVPATVGAMAAIIGLSDDDVIDLCGIHRHNQVLMPANYNALGQVVVAGHVEAVGRLVADAKNAGAKLAKVLSVSVPSHCSLMDVIVDEYTSYLNGVTFSLPDTTVIHNTTAKRAENIEQLKENLLAQLSTPVQWVKSVQYMGERVQLVIELGPSKVLTGLIKRIEKGLRVTAIGGLSDFAHFDK